MDEITLAEYELLMKAERLKQIDLDYRCHLIAFLTKAASAEKPAGKGKSKPVYKNFKKFFDYEKRIKEVLTETDETDERFARIKAYRRMEE